MLVSQWPFTLAHVMMTQCRSVSVIVTVLDTNDSPPVLTNSPLTATTDVLEVLVFNYL